MWTGPDARPINLPAALARRRLVGGAFLEEVMTPAAASGHDSFTRIAHLNYNAVSRRYEYASLDTRAPQMMTYEAGTNSSMRAQDGVMLQGGTFVAPQW